MGTLLRFLVLSWFVSMKSLAFTVPFPQRQSKSVPMMSLQQSTTDATVDEVDYEVPEDSVVKIKPNAMKRLRELREKQESDSLVLRMGVRNGGCSGLSYVMDFSTEDDIQEDDAIDEYPAENLKCVVDAKSMLYLYGLELDYSEELIGGGFKFFNPNAEESCGCGSSFGV
jgi:iron-sulfur cluster assembly accessory protein